MIPPWLIHLRIRRPGGRGVGLWLPVLLLWPLIWMVAALMMLMALLVAPFVWRAGWTKRVLLFVPCALALLSATKGLEVSVIGADSEFRLKCY